VSDHRHHAGGRRLEFDLLGDIQSVIHLDPEISDSALQLRMAEEELHRAQVASLAIDLGGLRASHRVRAMIPAGPVLSPQQALDHPHIRTTGFMQDVDYPDLPIPAPVDELPSGCRKRQGEIVARPPMLGEHTDLVLVELGYDTAAIVVFRQ
jgi:hypothetical protein